MRLLLDTHTFLWWDSDPEKLSARALALCEDPANQLHLSVASLWEIEIKLQVGKLKLASPLSDLIAGQQSANGLILIPIQPHHVYALNDLPPHHKDPFDRMILVQARQDGLRLISHDGAFQKYPVDVVW